MYHVVNCNGYRVLDSLNTADAAMDSAKNHQRNTTWGIIIRRDSRVVGDADRWYPDDDEPFERDHATLTGMYDRY